MKKWTLWLMVCLFYSCTDTLEEEPNPFPDDADPYITLTVQVPGVNNPRTYANGLTEIEENKINHIDVLAFTQDENGKEVFSYRVTVYGSDIRNAEGSEDGSKKIINLKLKRQTTPVKLMVLGNSYSTLIRLKNDGLLKEDITLKSEIENALTFNGTYWREDNLSSFEGFPMWGETSGFVPYGTVSATTNQETVLLLRAVAKIDIGADIYGDPALGFGSRFKIERVLVYRGNKTGYIVPDRNILTTDNIVTAPTIPQGVEQDDPFAFTYEVDTEENAMVRKIYLAEAKACEGGNENQGICLVVGARFDGGNLTYYRVDFMDNSDNYIPILRNHRYLVNITSIAGDGYADPLAAANSKSSSLIYGIQVTDEHINDIVYNNEHMLGVSNNVIYMDWKQDSFADLVISTTNETGWLAGISYNDSYQMWFKMAVQEGEGGVDASGNAKKTVVRLTVNEQNREMFMREATITIVSGSLTQKVAVRQRMGANSYIAKVNGGIEIPVAFANADGTERVVLTDVVTPVILWQSAPSVISTIQTGSFIGPGTIFTVNTGTVPGNAVIGALVGGKIVWSWHVWVTDYEPEDNIRYNNGYTFMDRNLGALGKSGTDAYGLVYQWGRKDPFPNSVMTMYSAGASPLDFEAEPVTAGDNLENAIANPTVFYTSSGAPYYSWQGTTTSSNFLWTDADGNKTPYDPCPDGWRVPVSGTGELSPWYGAALVDLVDNKAPGYYPLAGGRMNDTGEPGDVGIRGYTWSATPYSFNAFLFQYGAGAVNPSAAGYRANGYPVRCVKE